MTTSCCSAARGPGDRLDHYHPDAILWERSQPLSQLLQIAPGWRIVYTDGDWIIAEPR